jgi:hypothetical protein
MSASGSNSEVEADDWKCLETAALRQKRFLGQSPSLTLKITVRRRREFITLVYQAPPEKFAECVAAIG